MTRLLFFIEIQAPTALVWRLMWAPETFGLWMSPMGNGHYYEPSLIQGGSVRWLTPSGDGMYGKVKELTPGEKIVFEHHGWISKGINSLEDTFSSEEKYMLHGDENKTKVTIEVDTFDEYTEMMQEKYPLVLAELKKIAEQHFFLKNKNIDSI